MTVTIIELIALLLIAIGFMAIGAVCGILHSWKIFKEFSNDILEIVKAQDQSVDKLKDYVDNLININREMMHTVQTIIEMMAEESDEAKVEPDTETEEVVPELE